MANYLISFPAAAMKVPAEELAAVGEAARAVIREAKAAGVYAFGGGINADVAPLMVALVLFGVGSAASWHPARRAARVDPMVVLKGR